MLASRTNNENAIYQQQRTAGAKPLNSNPRGLAPQTPANVPHKTPFRNGRNDENLVAATKGKGRAKEVIEEKCPVAKSANDGAFNTPYGPVIRAPLGNKTTNVHTTKLQTPGARLGNQTALRKVGSQTRRPKLKVHQSDELAGDSDEEFPDIEHMAPRGEPLPDYPDEWPHDRAYPQFEGKNLTRGWYMAGVLDREEGDEQLPRLSELLRKAEAKRTSSHQPQDRHAMHSRHAASALASRSSSVSGVPPRTSNLSATRQRIAPTPDDMRLAKTRPAGPAAASSARHPVAKAASNTTVGYSKGRSISTSARTSQSVARPSELRNGNPTTGPPTRSISIIDEWLSLDSLQIGGGEDDEGDGLGAVSVVTVQDDEHFLENFQLPDPRLID